MISGESCELVDSEMFQQAAAHIGPPLHFIAITGGPEIELISPTT
jgi:hypothetical protein